MKQKPPLEEIRKELNNFMRHVIFITTLYLNVC